MTSLWENNERRALQLLADRATFGLSVSERRELDELLAEVDWLPPDAMDRTAAAAELAFIAGHLEPLPAGLGDKIKSHGHRTLRKIARVPTAGRRAE